MAYSGQSFFRQTPWTGAAEHYELHLLRYDLHQMHPKRFQALQGAMQTITTCLADPDGRELLERPADLPSDAPGTRTSTPADRTSGPLESSHDVGGSDGCS